MGQQECHPHPHSPPQPQSSRNYAPQKQPTRSAPRLDHEGILKLRSTPFPNCIQLNIDNSLLFLENAQITLGELLQSRLYTNRLFPLQDVQKLIQNVVYTLAHICECETIYKDLSPQNIYYSHGNFKLLPNELIQLNFYDNAWTFLYGLKNQQQTESMPYVSPELVIALRMKQKSIDDFQILSKSTVFIFGLILLETTTLLPSRQCFDPSNYDIFNNLISDRLALVEEHYNECIARIIANMLDYDFNQRMDLKELSIWVNRELANSKTQPNTNNSNIDDSVSVSESKSVHLNKSQSKVTSITQAQAQVKKSRISEQKNQEEPVNTNKQQVFVKSYSRTNTIYINGYDDGTGIDEPFFIDPVRGGVSKNSVYLGQIQQYDADHTFAQKSQHTKSTASAYRNQAAPNSYSFSKNQSSNRYNPPALTSEEQEPYSQERQPLRSYNRQRQPKQAKQAREQKQRNRPEIVPYFVPPEPQVRQVSSSTLKHRNYQEQIPLRRNYTLSQLEKENKVQPRTNKFYPSLQDMENLSYSDTKRTGKQNNKGSPYDSRESRQSDRHSANDGSINRIKLEIEKSRKLIEEFRKCETITP